VITKKDLQKKQYISSFVEVDRLVEYLLRRIMELSGRVGDLEEKMKRDKPKQPRRRKP
jgi:hypothetical protein